MRRGALAGTWNGWVAGGGAPVPNDDGGNKGQHGMPDKPPHHPDIYVRTYVRIYVRKCMKHDHDIRMIHSRRGDNDDSDDASADVFCQAMCARIQI